ncbi:N-acetylglucosamine kinase [Undibacterium sp.]|uniref:N-acetylglucosamine kinase n=1 Tax=Undibacterium sp. TaxID=1914977 RepID=UPI002CEA82DF|nr:BadF/BadG/BcrA/BcrD ATPase family protein [Undibacterium sp.]HTD03247.1 BadF/BadG/BcrA/BcrD ATPase family protein [Undibacterium sp.]
MTPATVIPESLSATPKPGRKLGLGIDAGGTQTRWALANDAGQIIADGFVDGFSALQIGTPAGRRSVQEIFHQLVQAATAYGHPVRVRAGLTGFGGQLETADELRSMLALPLNLSPQDIILSNDIELAYLDNFCPGEGYLVYSGTGSIAAFIDADGSFHRAGGHGGVLDDAGGGFWIAREALRHIWRTEDEQPGSWHKSAMALRVFEYIGGNDWSSSRQFIYNGTRGQVGMLALAVAAAADTDMVAYGILKEAGRELARLGAALCARYGIKPIILAGRVQELHPVIAQSMRASLPAGYSLRQSTSQPHFAAARIASNYGRQRA